jgi:hypothetical protein
MRKMRSWLYEPEHLEHTDRRAEATRGMAGYPHPSLLHCTVYVQAFHYAFLQSESKQVPEEFSRFRTNLSRQDGVPAAVTLR